MKNRVRLLSPDVVERKISLSKVISCPRFVEDKIPIGYDPDQIKIRMVPESEFLELQQKLNSIGDENYQRGLQDGFQRGNKEGLNQGKADANGVIQQFQSLLKEIITQKQTIFDSLEKDLFDLALTISQKVVGVISERDQELVLDSIRKSLPLLLEKSKLKIKVAPEQEDFVNEQLEQIMASDKDLKEIQVEADRRISLGGCILETSSGRVNSGLEKQLEILEKELSRKLPQNEE